MRCMDEVRLGCLESAHLGGWPRDQPWPQLSPQNTWSLEKPFSEKSVSKTGRRHVTCGKSRRRRKCDSFAWICFPPRADKIMNSTSVTLLARLKAGGSEADWQRLVALYTPLLYYWAKQSGLQHSDAADLVQEVLALLVRKLPDFTYDKNRTFRGWLRTVTLNRLTDLRRRRQATPADGGGEVGLEPACQAASAQFWETEYQQQLVARALEIMRQSFEEKTWKACWEMVVNDKSARQVGAELGLSEGAVYVAKSRVLKRLREELDGLWD